MTADRDVGRFPVSAGILFGLGLGGFFDGIILHQVLQWHHMLTSAGYPPDSVRNLQINVMWDGLFHMSTYAFTAAGLYILWRYSRRRHVRWSGKLLPGGMLAGCDGEKSTGRTFLVLQSMTLGLHSSTAIWPSPGCS